MHLLEGELQPSTSTLMFGGKTLKFDLKLHICYVQRKIQPYGFKFATETGFQVASVLQDSTFAAPSVVLLGLGGPASPGPCRGRCGCGVVPDLCRRAGHTSPLDSGRRVRYARGYAGRNKAKTPLLRCGRPTDAAHPSWRRRVRRGKAVHQ